MLSPVNAIVMVLFLTLFSPWLQAKNYSLIIDETKLQRDGKLRDVLTYNGQSPGPTLHFIEGEEATIKVTNNLPTDTSIHWHGVIVPFEQDGVPGISFPGIKPGQTFTYRFPVIQSGTYWYHSHSGVQEQDGAYGSMVITPKGGKSIKSDSDYVVVLSETHPHSGDTILRNLKKMSDYYNRQQLTLSDLFNDAKEKGFADAVSNRWQWGKMRMMQTDLADVQGYTFLMNGKTTQDNWNIIFKPGEKIRLRFINASAMTIFDVRIPGLKMQVVQADGNNIEPIWADEFRISVAETYDVIIQPAATIPYAIFAESMARTGSVNGTLSPRRGEISNIPQPRQPKRLTMADMGMQHDMNDHDMPNDMPAMQHDMSDMSNHDMSAMQHSMPDAETRQDVFYAQGSGLTPSAAEGERFLSYSDLKALIPLYPHRKPTREIELRLTGNMERYMWSINDIKYEDAKPLILQYGERVRFKFINETMMTHPMHLHGMWTILDNGNGPLNPAKHVVNIAPGTTVYTETEVDAEGQWAFHCHMMYHMAAGMFRKVVVQGGPDPSTEYIRADYE